MPEQAKPKPCPICPPDKSNVIADDLTKTLSITRVQCWNCGLMIRSTNMDKAIRLWNTRHEPDEMAELRAIVEKLDLTADGVRVIRGIDRAWLPHDLSESAWIDDEGLCGIGGGPGAVGVRVEDCYFAREAALAAFIAALEKHDG